MAAVTGAVALGVGAAVSAGGAYMNYKGQKKAAKKEAEALRVRNEATKLQNSIRRRQVIRDVRASRGRTGVSFAASGAGSEATSSATAVMGTQRSQLTQSLNNSALLESYGDRGVELSVEAQEANTYAALGRTVGAVGSTIASWGARGLAGSGGGNPIGGGSVPEISSTSSISSNSIGGGLASMYTP